jgi:hypothetical protein
MNELEKYLDELLIFMANEIECNASTLNMTEFNFSFAYNEKYFNAEDEKFEDGEDLKNFKATFKVQDNELIKKVLMKALNEKFIERNGMSEFSRIQLTDNGFKKSKAIKLNRRENKKKWLSYPFEKLILPILLTIITAFIASYITSEIQNKNIATELETLKKDIEWIKKNK